MKQFQRLFVIACVLAACFAFSGPSYGFMEKESDIIEDSCAAESGSRILITYDTKHGATATVAKMIFDTICATASGAASVDLVFVENLDPAAIESYDAVIIGSPIYMGKWLRGITRLLRGHHAALAKVNSAFFITCTYIKEDGNVPPLDDIVKMYMDPVLSKYSDIEPVSLGVLAGEFEFSELYFFEWFLMKISGFEEGDFIDKAKVDAWATEVWDSIR